VLEKGSEGMTKYVKRLLSVKDGGTSSHGRGSRDLKGFIEEYGNTVRLPPINARLQGLGSINKRS